VHHGVVLVQVRAGGHENDVRRDRPPQLDHLLEHLLAVVPELTDGEVVDEPVLLGHAELVEGGVALVLEPVGLGALGQRQLGRGEGGLVDLGALLDPAGHRAAAPELGVIRVR
jgi:hypothetical protein